LRHTAASLAVSAGANVKAVQRMLGHASAAMTLDRYADLFDDDLDAVADTARRRLPARDAAEHLRGQDRRGRGLTTASAKPSTALHTRCEASACGLIADWLRTSRRAE
jgi:hypothetical protein